MAEGRCGGPEQRRWPRGVDGLHPRLSGSFCNWGGGADLALTPAHRRVLTCSCSSGLLQGAQVTKM